MLHYLLTALAGLAGSAHCIGMCGGFACVMGRDARGAAATLRRHLIYNLGRVTTYCFLGTLAGALGVALCGQHDGAGVISLAQRVTAVFSGALMLYIGLQFWGLLRGGHVRPLGAGASCFASGLRQLARSPGVVAPLALGALNGFLPCPLVYAFLAQAAVSGSAQTGLATMAAFGLGTFPAMLAMSGIGVWLRPAVAVHPPAGAPELRAAWRLHSVRIAGGFIVLLGVITFARGVWPLGAHWH